ncbi:hypothetical protein LAZ67_2002864 [Cordylochernes scorpioides]|uniref:Peptidase aspartic putative domain-containing protein n=1 Tax=Cordylochernes scorpioides TaxID=51811 RepID=A0ABY6K5I6_9ARAC|nr:hypothetical protein LAZ67_2002864 [Cordylochernes scorpioides]
MEPLERRRKVKQLKLCFNCLRNNHSVNQCKSEFKCRKCQGKHNTLIHIDAAIHQFKEHTVGIPAIEEPDKNQAESSPCRALIDTASEAILITRDCLKKLNLEPSRTRVELAGIEGHILDRPDGVINLNFIFHFNLSKVFKTNALVMDKVTNYISYLKFEEHKFHHLQGQHLYRTN